MFYFFCTPVFLHVSIALTITNTSSACLFDFHVGQTNPGIFGVALTFCCTWHSGSSMPLLCAILDSLSAMQLFSPSFGLDTWSFQLSQSSLSEMLSDALSSSLSNGWWLILRIQQTFTIWVHSPGRSFSNTAGGKGDLSDNLNAAAQSCSKSDQDALTVSSVSEIYPTAVILLFWAQHSFWVARKFWLPCQISNQSWTLAILFNFLSSTLLHIQVSARNEPRMAGADMSCMAGADVSCMAGDGDVLYGWRWLLTLIRADGIQPYLHSHISWPCKPSWLE